jgi:hypothetical protein
MLCLWVVLAGCAAMTPVPDGAQLQGTYQGLVWGGMDGQIQVQTYLTTTGDFVFAGQFAGGGGINNFKGTIDGNALSGTIDMMLGTIEGQLSPDGSQMQGVLKLAQYRCQWSAGLQ